VTTTPPIVVPSTVPGYYRVRIGTATDGEPVWLRTPDEHRPGRTLIRLFPSRELAAAAALEVARGH
jgi:hypothetical protein